MRAQPVDYPRFSVQIAHDFHHGTEEQITAQNCTPYRHATVPLLKGNEPCRGSPAAPKSSPESTAKRLQVPEGKKDVFLFDALEPGFFIRKFASGKAF